MSVWTTFPDLPGDDRTAWLKEQGEAGRLEYTWSDLTLRQGPDKLLLRVLSDACKIEGIRFPVTAQEAQMLADMMDCVLLTPKLLDERHMARAWDIPAQTRDPRGHPRTAMMTKAWTLWHNAQIEAELKKLGYNGQGIVSGVGKIWGLTNRITASLACNYGMYRGDGIALAESLPPRANVRLWQGPGYRHNAKHSDYSQTHLVADVRAWLNDAEVDLRTLYGHPQYHSLVTTGGPLFNVRQPGVPVFPVVYGNAC